MKIEAYQGSDYFMLVKDNLHIIVDKDSFEGVAVPVHVSDPDTLDSEKLIGAIVDVEVGCQYATDYMEELAMDGMVIQSDATKKVLTRQNSWWMHGSRPLTSLRDFEEHTESWTLLTY